MVMVVVTSMTRTLALKLDSEGVDYHFKWSSDASSSRNVMAKIIKNSISQDAKEIELHGFENINLKDLKRILRLPKDNFQVKLEPLPCMHSYKVHLSFLPSINSTAEVKSPPFLSILDVNYIHELVPFFRDSPPALKQEILKGMVKFFSNLPDLDVTHVREIVAIITFLRPDDFKEVIRRLIFLCNRSSSYLENLNEVLSFLKRINSNFNWNLAKKTDPLPKQANLLEIDDCEELIRLIYSSMVDAKFDNKTAPYLQALIVLLEFATNLEIETNSTLKSTFYVDYLNKIKRYVNNDNFLIKFLSNYAIENLKIDKNFEKTNHQLLRFCAQQTIPPCMGPWDLLVGRTALPIGPFSPSFLEKVWQELILFQNTYLIDNAKFLMDFYHFKCDSLNRDNQVTQKFNKALEVGHDYYFVEGLIDLLRSRIDLHVYTESTEIVQDSMELLLKIREDNSSKTPKKHLHFNVKNNFKNTQTYMRNRIDDILHHYSQCSSPLAVQFARQSLTKLNDNKSECDFSFEPHRCQLFMQSVQSLAPYFKGLCLMKSSLLADSQISKSQECMIPLDTLLTNGERTCLSSIVNSYLTDFQNKAIFIQGSYGSGKSSVITSIALEYLKRFRLGEPIPLFIKLGELSNPKKKFIEETLKKYEMMDSSAVLQQEKTIWFIDDFDKVFEDGTQFNFYQTNDLTIWPRAQFVLTCTKEVARTYFNPNLVVRVREDLQLRVLSFKIAPLNEKQQYSFLMKKIPNEEICSTTAYKLLVNNLEIIKFVCNPLLLNFLVEYFPNLFQKDISERPNKEQIFNKLISEKNLNFITGKP